MRVIANGGLLLTICIFLRITGYGRLRVQPKKNPEKHFTVDVRRSIKKDNNV